MKINFFHLAAMAGVALLLMVACKPTEKNYREAYDVAIKKQQQEQYDEDLGINRGSLIKEGEARLVKVGDDSIYWLKENLKGLSETDTVRHYNLAVARFKMPTNVKAMTQNLKDAGYAAYTVQNGTPLYYVIVEGYDSLGHAIKARDAFRDKNRKWSYIGLPSEPIVLESVRFTPYSAVKE